MSHLADSVGEPQWKNAEPHKYLPAGGPQDPSLENFDPIPNMKLYGFKDGNETNELFCIFEVPHEYKPGTELRPHIHWTPNDDQGGVVKWQLCYSIGDNGVPFQAGTTIAALSSALGRDTYNSKEFDPPIPASNITGGTIIVCRLFRDATDPDDNYPGIAKLLTIGLHYQSEKLGSTSVFVNE